MASVPAQTQQLLLRGGYYQARSVIANAQRCVNVYPEKNPEDSETPYTEYLRPGLLRLRAGGTADGPLPGVSRCGYVASNGQLFIASADAAGNTTIFSVDAQWRCFALGSTVIPGTTPISMFDNGFSLVIVDGSAYGYQVDLTTMAFSQIIDAAFYGADRVDYLDTFLIYNRPGTRQFYVGPSNAVTPFDPTYIASKTGLPDPLATVICMHREIWLPGTRWSSEVWYDAGNPAFPFQITPGVFMEQGCIAKYSVCKHNLSVFWLGRDRDGQVTVIEGKNYQTNRVSTPAIEVALSQYTESELELAVGMVYKLQGHIIYMLMLPDRAWCYDQTEGLWHEQSYTDSNGVESRHRANWVTLAYGQLVCGDYLNGNLYAMDLATYVDQVNGVNTAPGFADSVSPIVKRRGLPHVVKDGFFWQHTAARLDVACGNAPDDATELDTQVWLRWSDDRGRSWGDPVPSTFGLAGQYLTQPRWPPLGIARDRVYEVFWSGAFETALNGLWVDLVRTGK